MALALAGPAQADFGISSFHSEIINKDGSASTQAGGHPYQVTTTIDFNTITDVNGAIAPDDQVRDTRVDLPVGLTGNPSSASKCTETQLETRSCPADSQVGVAAITISGGLYLGVPVFNMVPASGQPGQFAFNVVNETVHLDAMVRSDDDYGISINLSKIPEPLPIVSTTLVFWGVPADPSHDAQRGSGMICIADINDPANCFGGGSTSTLPPTPFLTNPTSCSGGPFAVKLSADSWTHPGVPVKASFAFRDSSSNPLTMKGCDRVPFAPTVTATADGRRAGAPSGLSVNVHVPQSNGAAGIATSAMRKAVVELPPGMAVSPSSADGLGACTPEQIGLHSTAPPACPDSSKLGTVEVDTPLLDEPLKGAVYLTAPTDRQLLALYLTASGSGVQIKLAGTIDADPTTGRLTATFDDNPQLPFSDLTVTFKTGPRAALRAPKACGAYTTRALLTPWSSVDGTPVASDSPMPIDQDCDRAGKFEPALNAGLVDPTAGGSSTFVFDVTRPDGQQDISSIDSTLPLGLLARLRGVPRCPEAQAATGTCGAESRIGSTTVGAGAGPAPIFLPQAGKAPTAVYLAGPYKDAPFSLSVVVPAQAGPYDLGTVVVRAGIYVDPVTARASVRSDPLPTILRGIPLDVREVRVTIDRPGFIINPTNCSAQEVTGTITSAAAQAVSVANRFQVGDCSSLPLRPKLSLSLSGKGQTTDGKHPALSAVLSQKPGQANLKQVAVTLPLSLALDQRNAGSDDLCEFTAGQQTIPDCPKNSIVGSMTARTPVLDDPLTGPVYFIKNVRTDPKSGRQIRTLPTLATVLQGDGVTLVLRATTAVVQKHLVTTFANLPDAPVSDVTVNINGGPKSILVVSGADLCKATQIADQAVDGQNGKVRDAEVTITTPCRLGVAASSHTSSSLKVTVGGLSAGMVSLSGKGLVKTSRAIKTATTATLSAPLTVTVRRALARGREVKLAVAVTFTPAGAKKAQRIVKHLVIHGAVR
ncbi:hypothetical protein [Baekduia sp.]|uniref:hypothetical protein n=1 Tax=Baekduia sp. TaxID=2600305 RepID=UPI002E07CB77|nr:hypothetical protein [Baekduia sp.]